MVKDLNDPTNVDTVPAMLTEGEFVLNKEATQMYGPIIEQMNNNGLLQRKIENEIIMANTGKKVSKLYKEGYTAPGQAYAIAKSMGYNVGGLVQFLKDKEGWRDKAYQDDAGVWTIGYGRTGGVKPGHTTTKEAEDAWLQQRAQQEWDAVSAYGKKHGYNWAPNQIAALASFRYNGGQGMLDQLTDNGKRDNAAIQTKLPQYNKITDPNTGKKIPLKGLTNRRNAELELWGGQGNQVPGKQEAPPPMEAPPPAALEPQADMSVPESNAPDWFPQDTTGTFGGFATDALRGIVAPQRSNIVAPQMGRIGQNPEYIPSVATKRPQAFQKDEFGIARPVNIYGSYNMGGPIQYLRAGGKVGQVKVWDGTKYIWVDRSDPRAQRDRALAAQAQQQQAPLNFRQAAQVRAQQQVPQIPRPEGDSTVSPLGPRRIPKLNRFQQEAGALAGKIMTAFPPQSEVPPQIDKTPPVPGTDEAILQNSSQQVEAKEEQQARMPNNLQPGAQNLRQGAQWDTPQPPQPGPGAMQWDTPPPPNPDAERLRHNALLGDYARQFPKGDPRRAAAFNQQLHQKGAVPPTLQFDLPPQPAPPPQPLNIPEPQGRVTDLSGLTEEEIGALYDQGNPAAIQYAENEEKQQQVTQALNEVRAQQTVAAPETEGAEVLRQREKALEEQLAGLQDTPEGALVSEVGEVPNPLPTPEAPVRPDAWSEAELPDDVNIGGIQFPDEDLGKESTAEQKFGSIPNEMIGETDEDTRTNVIDDASKAAEGKMTEADNKIVAGGSGAVMEAGKNAPPGRLAGAKSKLKQMFGNLFDPQELARMAIMYVGSRLLGGSHVGSLQFAAQNYLGRVDAKEKRYHELVKSGKYSPESLKIYKETGDPSQLMALGEPPVELGNTKEFYSNNGTRIQAREVKVGDNKVWLDANNQPINLNAVHEEASRAPGTEEYRKRITDEAKTYTSTFKELQDRFGTFETDEGKQYATELTGGKVGLDAAKWAAENDVSPDAMGSLLDNAYRSAIADSKDGKTY